LVIRCLLFPPLQNAGSSARDSSFPFSFFFFFLPEESTCSSFATKARIRAPLLFYPPRRVGIPLSFSGSHRGHFCLGLDSDVTAPRRDSPPPFFLPPKSTLLKALSSFLFLERTVFPYFFREEWRVWLSPPHFPCGEWVNFSPEPRWWIPVSEVRRGSSPPPSPHLFSSSANRKRVVLP